MARTGHSVTILTSTGDVVPNAPIEIRLYLNDLLANIFEQDGTPITQTGATADENGIFRFWADPNEYYARHGGVDVPVTVGLDSGTFNEKKGVPVKTLAEAVADESAEAGDYVDISDRGMGRFTYLSGLAPDGFSEIQCTGDPSLSLKLTHDDTVTAKNFGATNSPSTTENLQAFIDYVGSKQLRGELGQGGFHFNQDIVMKRNSNIRGVGGSFGSTLVPEGDARIVFRGDLEPGGFVFHASLVGVSINGALSTLTNSELVFLDNTFSIDLDIRAENLSTSTNNKMIHIKNSNDININKPTLFGTSSSSGTGILIGDNATVKIYSPDVEVLNRGIKVDGNEATVVDVFGMYTERNIVAVENLSGNLNLHGGKITNASGSSVAAILNSKTRVYGTKVVLSGGQGITTTKGTNPDVEFFGVDQGVIQGDFFTGSNTSLNKNGQFSFDNIIVKTSHVDDSFIDLFSVETGTASAPSIVSVELWATSNGYGRAFKTFKFMVSKESGGSCGISIVKENDMTNSGSANFNITVDINAIAATNGVTVQGKFTMTGASNSGNTTDLHSRVRCISSEIVKMRTL